ncbi:hypothetical protein BGW38_003798 [Lunasporangiospora selenospora]|uniref:SWI/SNF related-matrix-associated actin-dependent regulator of chromatin subfamily C n=1 Tax=Lunasporangiospora selenospora TaxID=979761 RepID=A0A9P6G1J4_9FUNG|nr:hypothetical protein BGW38_003798 [Lunasporangiospora selenospora]
MTARRKSGGSDAKFYEAPGTIAQFEHIKDEIARDLNKSQPGSDISLSAKELSQFTYALQQFQEDVLGTNNAHLLPSAPARIPAKVFRSENITPDSPLYKILKSAYEFRIKQGWRRWDLTSQTKKTQNLELIIHIRRELVSSSMVKNPAVAFDDSVSNEDKEKLGAAVERMGGTIVKDPKQASHIIHHSAEELESPEGEEWLRTLEKKDGRVLVHYWYYPDSYDEWLLETSSEFMDPEPVPEHTGAWNISTRWVRDSEKYNEWMNEEDYEPSSDQNTDQESTTGSPAPSSHRFSSKRDFSDKSESSSKRVKRSSSSTPLDAHPDHPGLQVVSLEDSAPKIRGSKKNEYEPIPGGDLLNLQELPSGATPDASSNTAENVDEKAGPEAMDIDVKEDKGATKEGEGAATEGEAKEVDTTAEQVSTPAGAPLETEDPAVTQSDVERFKLEEEAGRFLSQQAYEVIIPSYAAWFSMSKIHDIEQKSLPEFFNLKNRSKTPTVYKDYRDFMINTYRLNPTEYLTVTACRRNLAGDVCAIIRVHAFLEQWGLVNYQVDPDTRPSTVGPSFTGHFRITADTPRGLQPFQPHTDAATATAAKPTAEAAKPVGAKADVNLELRKNIYTSGPTPVSKDSDESAEKRQRFNCFTCGTDCTKNRYHSIKTKNMELCANCFMEGRFPSTMSSGDFIRFQNQAFKQSEEPWTDQETLLLLEGLEMFDEDWNQIADHVGTKDREQCILHFLQLPIEDPYVSGATEKELGPLQYHRVPFDQAENPVMSVVAFLASVVNPGVAAAAAQSALKELSLAKKVTQESIDKAEAAKAEAEKAKEQKANESQDGEMAVDKEDKPEDETEMDVDKSNGDKEDVNGTAEQEEEDANTTSTPAAVESKEEEIGGIPRSTLEKAATAALGSAAAKAKILADYEEREIQRLVTVVIEMQLKKLELKLKQFEELESVLDIEKSELERQRQQLYLDRLAMKKSIMSMQEKMILARETGNPQVFASVTVPPGGAGGTGMSFQNEVTVRQQQEAGQGLGPLSRDQNTEGVTMLPLP